MILNLIGNVFCAGFFFGIPIGWIIFFYCKIKSVKRISCTEIDYINRSIYKYNDILHEKELLKKRIAIMAYKMDITEDEIQKYLDQIDSI